MSLVARRLSRYFAKPSYPRHILAGMRSRTLLLVLPVLLAVGCTQIQRGEGQEPLRVLFVGNSLTATNDLPAVVATLAKALGRSEVEYRTIAPGGVSLEDHWAAGAAPAELASGDWDAVAAEALAGNA